MPEQIIHESGVAFSTDTDASVSVQATFIESGNQLHQVFIGTEPVLLVQPEYDADENEVKFVLTGVDLDPASLAEVLEVLLDAAREMAAQQAEAFEEFQAAVAARSRALQAAGPDEYPQGYYDEEAHRQIVAENAPVDPEQAEADAGLRAASEEFEQAERDRHNT